MSEYDRLFDSVDDKQNQPNQTNNYQTSVSNNVNLFSSKKELEQSIDDIVKVKNKMNTLFEELGDGRISDKLSIRKRNQIIEDIMIERDKLETITDHLVEPIQKNVLNIRGLQLIITTNTDGLERLLDNSHNQDKLSADEVQFQRRE